MNIRRFIWIILVLFCPLASMAQVTISNKYINSDTIRFGISQVTQTVETAFVINNSGSIDLKILDIDPSFYLGTPRDTATNNYEEFELFGLTLPLTIPAFSQVEFGIRFRPRAETAVYPFGHKTALLKIGVYDASFVGQPTEADFACYREFTLLAKKSNSDLDFYDNRISLDSVCINPTHVVQCETYFQNISSGELPIISEEMTYPNVATTSDELYRIDQEGTILSASEGEKYVRKFAYSPQTGGQDSADYIVKYQSTTGEILSTHCLITGYAAEQNLELLEAIGAEIKSDTIDIGDVRIGNTASVSIVFKNSGNLPFGVSSQTILQEQLDFNEQTYIFDKYLLSAGRHLPLQACDTIEIRFTPDRRGTIIGRLQIRSDIDRRAIKNVTDRFRNLEFYLKGRGVAPELSLSTDTLNFGNVVISDNCPVILDTSITLYNSGNHLLRISNIEILPDMGTPFEFENTELQLTPGETRNFRINFNSTGLPAGGEYDFRLIFCSNSLENSYRTVVLHASTSPMQDFEITLPRHISAKSGREIVVPIHVDKSKISSAGVARITLSYDKSILQYVKYDKIGTASEIAMDVAIDDVSASPSLEISLNALPDLFFSSDTLLLLHFRTFLSSATATPIVFNKVVMGNENCEQIFTYDLSSANAIFTIDSICGIDFKTLPESNGRTFSFENSYPNPSESFSTINFAVPYRCNVRLSITDADGRLIKEIENSIFETGKYSATFNCNDISAGTYYVKMTASNFVKSVILKVVR